MPKKASIKAIQVHLMWLLDSKLSVKGLMARPLKYI